MIFGVMIIKTISKITYKQYFKCKLIRYDNARTLYKLGEQSEINFQYSVFGSQVSYRQILPIPHKNKTIKL